MFPSNIEDVPDDDDLHPRLQLRIGITGHRPPRLKNQNLPRIEDETKALFAVLNTALEEIYEKHRSYFAPRPHRVVLVSPLASGSDSLLAEVALRAGAEIDACLPFSQETYREDFEGAQLDRFDRLSVHARRILCLPGEDGDRDEAYRAVGLLTASQCDILLAVWDGKPAGGVGGTAEIVADAVATSLPVIVIDAEGRNAPRLLWNVGDADPHDTPTLDTVASFDAKEHLADVVAELVAPPPGSDVLLSDMESARGKDWRNSIGYPLLLALTGARDWKSSFRRGGIADSAGQIRPLLTCFQSAETPPGKAIERLVARFAAADVAANRFAQRYRGGYITNFAMSAIAVTLALTSLLLPGLKIALIIGELATILLIVLRTRKAGKWAWHRRWIDARHLAELLRLLPLSAALGDLTLLRQDESERRGSHGWCARATAREIGMCEGTVSRDRVLGVRSKALDLIDDQIRYHRANSTRMGKMDHRLRHTGEALFISTILACIAWLLAKLLAGEHAHVLGLDLTSIVTFLTALLPAIGAALYGIRMQGDFAGSAERSRVILRRLGKLRNAIDRDPPDYRHLTSRLRRLSEIMLAEVDQWRQLSEVRPLELPG